MKKKCRIVIICGSLLLGAALAFPPIQELDVNSEGRLIGDHITWRLPRAATSAADEPGALVLIIRAYDFPVRRDILALEIITIVAGSLALCFLFRKKEREKQ
ncbi:MAG TPA: hypothetical protein P5119_12450 [Candidatus Aminicenantes bacterium]|nr:hypothetical protein [Candidatus Aminicenantes bacterium]HRY66135.1 hypothetical protein [Candidatus Aminicenantes bacterium]HRZ73049.1 hypothetical protein [Candidatus Aminicenantes bacterium]